MHEERFVLAFREVDDAHEQGEALERGCRLAVRVVDVRTESVHEGVDEEGSEVFDDEDGAPGYLGAWR